MIRGGKDEMIQREHYLSQIEPFMDNDLIKVIIGIRRCGKSTILRQLAEAISAKNQNVVFLEFENTRIRVQLQDADQVIRYVDEHRKGDKCYVFLDEIQEVENWPDICQTLRLENCSVFISGSNSKLLSSEFADALSGRYVSFRIHPFVWRELQEYAAELGRSLSVSDYFAIPGISTAAILTFVYAWNEYMLASLFLSNMDNTTLTVALAMFSQQNNTYYAYQMAASSMASIPAAILLVCAQKYIVQGLSAGAVKG